MNNTIVLGGDWSGDLVTDGSAVQLVAIHGGYPVYDGATTVTPTNAEQVLATAGKVVTDNITINPIPNNYGLITWNGAVLTVS